MSSLKELVEEYGFGVMVSAKSYKPFTIVKEVSIDSYLIEEEDGRIHNVLKECPSTNDYEKV